MRMWMVNPKILCRQHLIGEYRELFTFLGTLKKKKSVQGYFKNNLFEPMSLQSRYEEIKDEMIRRGYNPKKEFVFDESILNYLEEDKFIKINKKESLKNLLGRCDKCKKRFEKLKINLIFGKVNQLLKLSRGIVQ